MIYLQRKLRAQFAGDEKYRPQTMPATKYLPVMGWSTKRRLKVNNGKQEYVDEPYLIIIGSDGKPLEVVMFNLKIMIDDRSEVDTFTMTQLLRNITIIGKALCEKFTGIHPSGDDKQIQEETGKESDNRTVEPV